MSFISFNCIHTFVHWCNTIFSCFGMIVSSRGSCIWWKIFFKVIVLPGIRAVYLRPIHSAAVLRYDSLILVTYHLDTLYLYIYLLHIIYRFAACGPTFLCPSWGGVRFALSLVGGPSWAHSGSCPLGVWMFVCCEYCVMSGRGLFDGLITRPGESYRLWRVVVCYQETS